MKPIITGFGVANGIQEAVVSCKFFWEAYLFFFLIIIGLTAIALYYKHKYLKLKKQIKQWG